jgi:predicted glycosyltransferase
VCYRDSIGKKQKIYDSYHSLAYLHKNNFTPDKSVLSNNGIPVDERYVFIRFVSWGAMHDVGLMQLTHEQKTELVKDISRFAKVLISAEGELEEDLKQYQINVPIQDIHHVLAFADLVVGESATMCSEASVLGTFSVYIDEKGRGYTDELQEKYSLCETYKPEDFRSVKESVMNFLQGGEKRLEEVKINYQRMIDEKLDLSSYQLEQIERLYRDKA